jgi:hypothetical protein
MKSFLNLTLSIFVLLITSCSNKKERDFNQLLIQSFNESEKIIYQSTLLTLRSLEDRTYDPATTDRATTWHKRALDIKNTTNALIQFIDTLSTKEFTAKDLSTLYNKTIEYKSLLLENNEYLNDNFGNEFRSINSIFYTFGIDSLRKTNTPNLNIPDKSSTLVLATIKSKLRNFENKLIHFCYSETSITTHYFQTYSMIVAQNANILATGSIIEIKAGIGALSRASKPTITFEGTPVALNDEGYASFSKKVADKPGNYKTPVRVSFFNQTTGREETKEVIIEYKVVKPCD